MHAHEELLGADFYEHELKHGGVGVSRAVSVLKHYYDDVDPSIETRKGNKGKRELHRVIGPFTKKLLRPNIKLTNQVRSLYSCHV